MRKKDFFYGLLFTVFIILLVEGAPRLFFKLLDFPHPSTFLVDDAELGWKLKPGYHKKWIRINSLGFRGKDIAFKKPEKTFRVAALGESSTFGYGDDAASPYPLQLEAILNKNKSKNCALHFEVINAGVEKYFSWQVMKHFKRDVLPLKPDAVIVYTGWNDLYVVNPDTKTVVNPQSTFNTMISKSLTLRLLTVSVYRYIMPCFEKITPQREAGYKNFKPEMLRHNIHEIIRLSKKNNVHVVLVTLPSLLGSADVRKHLHLLHFPYFTHDVNMLTLLWESYNKTLRDMAEEENVPLADLDAKFRKLKRGGALFMDTLHENREGNRRAALALMERMAQAHVLPCAFSHR